MNENTADYTSETTAKPTLKLRTQSEATDGPPTIARTISPERLDRLHDMARANKRHPTDEQKALWSILGEQKTGGFKFKRQQIVGNTLVDFACPARWLVVEISGGASEEFNARKDRKLNEIGIRVMRFASERIMGDIDAVQEELIAELIKPFTRPRPVRRHAQRPVSDEMPMEGAALSGEPPASPQVSDAINALLAHCTVEELAGDAEFFGANYVHIFDAAMPQAVREGGDEDDTLIFWTTEANTQRRAEEGFADQAANVAIAFPVRAESEVADNVAEPDDLTDIDTEETKPTDA